MKSPPAPSASLPRPPLWRMRLKLVLMCTLLPAHLEYLLFPIALREGGGVGAALIAYPVLFAWVALSFMFRVQRDLESNLLILEPLLAARLDLVRPVESTGAGVPPQSDERTDDQRQ